MKLTPAMQQYMEVKNQYPDAIVLFRMGDFYETFYEDAKTAAKELDIALTARGQGDTRAPLAGIPYHSLEPYLSKLIKAGYKVAIVEQLEDPKLAKGVVKRGVVRIVTPGTIMEHNMLNENTNNYIMSIAKQNNSYGISLADISTGELLTTELNSYDKLLTEITKFQPSECIIPISLEDNEEIKSLSKYTILNSYDDRHFWLQKAQETIVTHFNNLNSSGNSELSISAIGALLSYLKDTQKTSLEHINKIKTFSTEDYMILDTSTQKNLELIKNILDNTTKGTLFETLDNTLTPMGSRLLKRWILQPLIKIDQIKSRHDTVSELATSIMLREELRELLKNISDIERLIGRITYGNANPRDLLNLKNSLIIVPEIKSLLKNTNSLKNISQVDEVNEVVELIEKTISDSPPIIIREGNIIKQGYNEELDKLRNISSNSKNFIADLEEKEKEKTGIKSLKVRYNKVFGYFIEITKANLHLVPKDYIRKQTQVNSERYITEELKEQEDLILNAEEKSHALEYELFISIIKDISAYTTKIQDIAHNIAKLDVLCSFANVAVNYNYTKPEITNESIISLKDSRHPVVERLVKDFVPNDITLTSGNKLHIITGPNMAGKSSLMRQVALITLMAQIGSFVPVSEANIGIVDRIFTRVGAYDDLTHGQSTFMVEMNETANILNNATEKSLIILDEIGRGTSTFDGISIAWSVAEYIHDNIKAKTMFATHYHQLNSLAERYADIKNYNLAVRETNEEITFIYKLVEGGTDKSYGIHVAKLAGVPNKVIERSKDIMRNLESNNKIAENIEHKEDIKIEKNTDRKKQTPLKETKQVTLLDL